MRFAALFPSRIVSRYISRWHVLCMRVALQLALCPVWAMGYCACCAVETVSFVANVKRGMPAVYSKPYVDSIVGHKCFGMLGWLNESHDADVMMRFFPRIRFVQCIGCFYALCHRPFLEVKDPRDQCHN
jgi:hypothetical protein